jgi:hypothetical protein
MFAWSDQCLRRGRASARALALGLGVCFGWSSAALAHGPAPSAISVIDADASGPKVIRLTAGYARRVDANRYDFICPAAWGDDVVLPAGLIPGGPVVFAGGRGLYLGVEDGGVKPHPDPEAAKPPTDFAQLGGKLYVLRTVGANSEVLEVDATTVKVVFTDPGTWTSITATSSAIGLLRLTEDRIEEALITGDGMVLSRESAPAPKDPILVLARATPSEVYVVVATATGRELGQIVGDQWKRIEVATSQIAGPVELPEGEAFVAVDTDLARLSAPQMLLEGMLPVSCLGRNGDLAYACTRDGLAAMSEAGVGEPIFSLTTMIAPDLTKVDAAQQSLCMTQWEHFRFDLLALGVELSDMPNMPPVAGQSGAAGASGSPPPAAGAGAQAGGGAGGAAGSGGTGTVSAPKDDGGCSVASGVGASIDSAERASGFGMLLRAAVLCALAFFISSRRRQSRRGR